MDDRIHIIIASEGGRSRALVVGRNQLRVTLLLAVVALLLLVISTWVAVSGLRQQQRLSQVVRNFQQRVVELNADNERLRQIVKRYRQENEELVQGAVRQLNARSSQLEQVLNHAGIKITSAKGEENSGGPFIAARSDSDAAIDWAQQILDISRHVPMGRPCSGYISSSFGSRRDPVNGRRAFHNGVDIADHVGAPIYATADGVVQSVGWVSGYGKMVKLKHGDRFVTVYGHLSKIAVRTGDSVRRGDVIARMGNTGRSTGPHLHYEIRDHGRAINPYRLTFL